MYMKNCGGFGLVWGHGGIDYMLRVIGNWICVFCLLYLAINTCSVFVVLRLL